MLLVQPSRSRARHFLIIQLITVLYESAASRLNVFISSPPLASISSHNANKFLKSRKSRRSEFGDTYLVAGNSSSRRRVTDNYLCFPSTALSVGQPVGPEKTRAALTLPQVPLGRLTDWQVGDARAPTGCTRGDWHSNLHCCLGPRAVEIILLQITACAAIQR